MSDMIFENAQLDMSYLSLQNGQFKEGWDFDSQSCSSTSSAHATSILTSKDSYNQAGTVTSLSIEHWRQAQHHGSADSLEDSMAPVDSSERDMCRHISTCTTVEPKLQAEIVSVTRFHPIYLMQPMSMRTVISSMMTQESPHSRAQIPRVLPL